MDNFINLELKLPNTDKFINLNDFDNDIFTLQINEIEKFKHNFIYKLFQICKFYSIRFNDLIIRQPIYIYTKDNYNDCSNKEIQEYKNTCICYLCNKEFKSYRSNMKICQKHHYCKCIDIYDGQTYEKELQKWNLIYYENNILYLEGKTYSTKSHQVSINNCITLYNHTNNVQNMTIQKRIEIIKYQKELGIHFLSQGKYEDRCKVNKTIAQNRILNKTHNLQYIYNIECDNNCKNFNFCNDKNRLKNIYGLCKEISSNNGMILKWCDRCNKETLHNGNNCIICNPNSKCGNQNKILKINNVLYYYDKSVKDYLSWEEYKLKFTTLSNNIELPKEFKIITTFRTQDSENWEGAKQAFEQSLLDLNVEWFVYIKFYINELNKSIPLVCGKSGSLSVNKRGSDVSFSIDINDGPARRFLTENNFKWDKTRIAILKCNSEKEAYKKEEFYLKELNLFGS